MAAIVGCGILLRRARVLWVSPALRLARLRSAAAADRLIMNSLSRLLHRSQRGEEGMNA